MMMVEASDSSSIHLLTINDKVSNKKTPQIKASLDKNKSQRMGDFSLK